MMFSKIPAYLFIGFCAVATLLSSCESQKPTAATATPATTEATPAASAASYECPMQCEGSKSDQPGKCPVCKMDLEKKS